MTVNVNDWSATPDDNTTVNSINIAEGCPPGNINGAIRSVMAGVKTFFSGVPDGTSLMPKSGGTFTGDITRQSQGAYLHHANASFSNGQVYYLPSGSPRPTPAEGVLVFYYSA